MKSPLFVIGAFVLLTVLLAVVGPFLWADGADGVKHPHEHAVVPQALEGRDAATISLFKTIADAIKQQRDYTVELEGRIVQLERDVAVNARALERGEP